jgi:thioredoxin 1
MFTYVSMLAGAVLGYVAAAYFLGPNETGTAMGGRIFVALLGALAGWWAASTSSGRTPIAWADEVEHVRTTADFDRILEGSGEKPVLVDFYADWCLPCRMAARNVNQLAKDGQPVVVVNIDKHPSLADRYNVMGVPTLLVLQEGKVAAKVSGYHSADSLREVVATVARQKA